MADVNFKGYLDALVAISKGSAASGKRLFREEPKMTPGPAIINSEPIGCTAVDGGRDRNHSHDSNYAHGKPQGDHGEKLNKLQAFVNKAIPQGPKPITHKLSENPDLARDLEARSKAAASKPRKLMDAKDVRYGYNHSNGDPQEPTDKQLKYGEKQNRTIKR